MISVYAGSYRTVRGYTLVGCVFDEAAFFRDETSAAKRTNPERTRSWKRTGRR